MISTDDVSEPYFTVFTPVYNGAQHLSRVLKSISDQTFRNFEWIIINDGSTDASADIIKAYLRDHPELDAKHIEQPNSGKHISWNRAVKLARGTLFVPADADDYFLPETLKFFHDKWEEIHRDLRQGLSGINVLCLDNDSDRIVGTLLPEDGLITNNVELEFRYKLRGEKWGCIRVDILKTRLFPVVKGSHFPESYLWYHFSRKYKVICYNKPLRRYYTTDSGITQSASRSRQTRSQHLVNLRYYLWLNSAFGLYLLRHAPESYINNWKVIFGSIRRILTTRRKASLF